MIAIAPHATPSASSSSFISLPHPAWLKAWSVRYWWWHLHCNIAIYIAMAIFTSPRMAKGLWAAGPAAVLWAWAMMYDVWCRQAVTAVDWDPSMCIIAAQSVQDTTTCTLTLATGVIIADAFQGDLGFTFCYADCQSMISHRALLRTVSLWP